MEGNVQGGADRGRIQRVIDDLNGNVAVLDEEGTIELVNTSWVHFAIDNGDPDGSHTGPGTNYFDACHVDDIVDGDFADTAVAGIRGVLSRQIPVFSLEYPCHSPTEERWFVMLVAPVGSSRAVVTHIDVSSDHQRGQVDPLRQG